MSKTYQIQLKIKINLINEVFGMFENSLFLLRLTELMIL